MRYDTTHKQRTHMKIIKEAAKAIRRHGPDNVSIVTLMSKLGLTHGGFYAHFKSKENLVVEAIAYIFEERYKVFRSCMAGAEPAEGISNFIDAYLSRNHCEAKDTCCPLVGLASEVPRMSAITRKPYEIGFKRMVDGFAEVFKTLAKTDPEALAISVISEMVGAVSIARSVSNVDYSAQVLIVARENIKRRIGLDFPTHQ